MAKALADGETNAAALAVSTGQKFTCLLRYARGALHGPHARVPTTQASGIFQFIDGLRGEALGGSLTRSDQGIRSMQIEIKMGNAQWA